MIRNLVCHIMPENRGKWRRTTKNIRKRLPLFNGRRIIALVTAPNCDAPETVQAAFGDDADSIEWLVFENDPGLREVISFVPMLERVESLDPNEMTFCCHGKGATHGHDDSICHCWCDLQWMICCDALPLVDCVLKDKAICGAFRTTAGNVGAPWHYSGTFYWICHDKTFSRDWRKVPRNPFGTEAWPGLTFGMEESGCLFLDNVGSLYEERYWVDTVFPAFQCWRGSLQRAGLSMTDYFPPSWFLERHPHFRLPNGPDGSAMTAPAKRSWRRLTDSLRRACAFSTK